MDRGKCQLLLACATSSLLLGKALYRRLSGEATPTSSLWVNTFLYLPTIFSYDLIPHAKDISAPRCSFFLDFSWQENHEAQRQRRGLGAGPDSLCSGPAEPARRGGSFWELWCLGVGRTSLCSSSAPGSRKEFSLLQLGLGSL